MLLWIARILLWIPLSILHPTFIKGKKNLPKGKVILSCNHYSNWDIALYILNMPEKIKILAKKELFKNKIFGAILRNFGGIEIDREANDINAIKQCFKSLKDGKTEIVNDSDFLITRNLRFPDGLTDGVYYLQIDLTHPKISYLTRSNGMLKVTLSSNYTPQGIPVDRKTFGYFCI